MSSFDTLRVGSFVHHSFGTKILLIVILRSVFVIFFARTIPGQSDNLTCAADILHFHVMHAKAG